MKFIVIADTELETPAGPVSLSQGQMIGLPKDEAIPLIEAGIITPEGRVAYKVFSNILQAFLWVVQDDSDADKLKAAGVTEPVYTGHEIAELKKLSRDDLKAIHEVKTIFEKSKIEEVI